MYVEGQMDKETRSLLENTHGILRGMSGLECNLVEHEEYLNILTTKNIYADFHIGKWVEVLNGLYKGDVGIIDSIHAWGATVLLLPRLSPDMENERKRKRKASFIRPQSALFDPIAYQSAKNIRVRHVDHHTYRIGKLVIVNGILRKDYRFDSIRSGVVTIPHSDFVNFEMSKHPRVLKTSAVRPREWVFAQGDYVTDTASGKYGVVENVASDYIEVEFEEGGTRTVSWRTVKKCFAAGDLVTVTGGVNAGLTGWIVSTWDDVAVVVSKTSGGVSSNTESDLKARTSCVLSFNILISLQEHRVMVNLLRRGLSDVIPVPDREIQTSGTSNNAKRHPWIGMDVLVSSQRHARKGTTGHIVEILPPATDNGKTRILIQTKSYNPHNPFTTFATEYTDVVDNWYVNTHQLHVRFTI